MTKQEKIQQAYGEYWDNLKDSVDENGYANLDNSFSYEDIGLELQDNDNWRPKSLKGLEYNNGWIKIEGEDSFPKEDIECYVTNQIGRIQFGEFEKETERFFVNNDRIFPTHYQQVTKPIYPLY